MLDHRLAPTPGRIGACNGRKMSQGLSHLSHLSLSKFQESPLKSQELPPTKSNKIQSTNGLETWWRLRAPAGSLGGMRGLPWHAQKRHHRGQSIRSSQISDRISERVSIGAELCNKQNVPQMLKIGPSNSTDAGSRIYPAQLQLWPRKRQAADCQVEIC